MHGAVSATFCFNNHHSHFNTMLGQQIYAASQDGDCEALRQALLDEAASSSAVELQHGSDKETALHAATKGNHIECVRELLGRGHANTEAKNTYGDTALHWAAERGNVECMEALLAAGGDPNSTTKRGVAPLAVATWRGHVVCANVLLQHGTALDAAGGGVTALHNAARARRVQCLELLLEAGASTEAVSSRGKTALHLAVWAHATRCVRLLLIAGASVHAVDGDCNTPLHLAVDLQYADCVEMLVRAGANVNADSSGSTVLLPVAAWGNLDCLKLLLGAGADVAATDGLQQTALHVAARHGNEECVVALVAAGASLSAVDWSKATPLLVAVEHGHAGCAAVLVGAGSSIEATDSLSHTALYVAVAKGHKACVEVLAAAGANVEASGSNSEGATALHVAAGANDVQSVAALIQAGASLEARTTSGESALCYAAQNGSAASVALLIKAGAVVEERLEWPPSLGAVTESLCLGLLQGLAVLPLLLFVCAFSDCFLPGLVTAILMSWYMGSADDDGECVDSGTSALALAAGGGHDDCVALLLAAGATAVDVSPEGVTSPLRAAVEGWHSSTVEQLTSVVGQLQPMPGLCDLDPELVAALSD